MEITKEYNPVITSYISCHALPNNAKLAATTADAAVGNLMLAGNIMFLS